MQFANEISLVWLIFSANCLFFLLCVLRKKKKWGWAAIFLTFAIAIYIYRKYLMGEVDFLYATSDGFSQYLPKMMNYTRVLSPDFSLWDFSLGFGNLQSIDGLVYPSILIPVLVLKFFGERVFEISIAWFQVFKIVVSAGLMYVYLRKVKLCEISAAWGSIIFAFCGVIILRGYWLYLADECYLSILLLLAAEKYFQDGQWKYIPISVALLGICLGAYYLYLYALVMIGYLCIRSIYDRKSFRAFAVLTFKSGMLYVWGILISAICVLGFGIPSLLGTAHFTETIASTVKESIFPIVEKKVLYSAVASFFDTNLLGVFDNYSGILNYLERPLFYLGINSLYFLPFAFCGNKKKTKFIIIAILLITSYMMFPRIMDIFNAMIKNQELGMRSYRLSTFWIIITLTMVYAYGFDSFLKMKKNRLPIIFGTFIILIAAFFLFCRLSVYVSVTIERSLKYIVYFELIGWAVFLSLIVVLNIKFHVRKNILIVLLLITTTLEMGYSAKHTINRSMEISKNMKALMQEKEMGYYGNLKDAIAYIQRNDDTFYRVNGNYANVVVSHYCASQYYGVKDTSYYAYVNKETYAIESNLYPSAFVLNGEFGPNSFINQERPDLGSKYSLGVRSNENISTLVSYKYYLANSEEEIPHGYSLWTTVKGINIYKNDNYLPIGIPFSNYITSNEFEKFNEKDRERIILHAVVTDAPQDNIEELTEEKIQAILQDEESDTAVTDERRNNAVKLNSWSQQYFDGYINLDKNAIVMYAIAGTDGWKCEVDGKPVDIKHVNFGMIGINVKSGKHHIRVYYAPKAFKIGTVITICSVMALLLAIGWSRGRQKKYE